MPWFLFVDRDPYALCSPICDVEGPDSRSRRTRPGIAPCFESPSTCWRISNRLRTVDLTVAIALRAADDTATTAAQAGAITEDCAVGAPNERNASQNENVKATPFELVGVGLNGPRSGLAIILIVP